MKAISMRSCRGVRLSFGSGDGSRHPGGPAQGDRGVVRILRLARAFVARAFNAAITLRGSPGVTAPSLRAPGSGGSRAACGRGPAAGGTVPLDGVWEGRGVAVEAKGLVAVLVRALVIGLCGVGGVLGAVGAQADLLPPPWV